ncbi:MAG: hypothetical protein SH857_06730 [Chitinophagales bacterium]|nr:hypothetical protein [Chitinophagales bacterium]
MKASKNKKIRSLQTDNEAKVNPGYPFYPASEDIYNQSKEEEEINPEDISKTKFLNENDNERERDEKDSEDDVSGDDLDVPGSELDDEQEKIGSEDEENNYYSLGGDDHNDLEEDKG